jgi:hypothetical protein
MSLGRTIRIYLDDGSVSSIRHAEIVNWTGQAVCCPRQQIKKLSLWPEAQKPGCYFLFGIDDVTGNPAVYIGEAENVYERLTHHLAKKDFWNETVFFTSKDENLTKSHVKYLEAELLRITKEVGRHELQNSNIPRLPALPRSEQASMQEYIFNLKTLLGVVGHKTLEPLLTGSVEHTDNKSGSSDNEESNETFFINVKNLNAKSSLSDEGMVVLKGSQANVEENSTLSSGASKLRDKLIDTGVLTKSGDFLVLNQNYLFTSPSQAASILVGYPINGRSKWKTMDGISLKEYEANSLVG